MPEAAASPTVRRRRLAAELRRLRERAELTGDQVAEHMHWSASKVSRLENAHTPPREAELNKLLQLYNISGPTAAELIELALEAKRKGWWEAYSDALPDMHIDYIGLESEASASHAWAPEVINGLLQTEAYAREMMRGPDPLLSIVPPGVIERRVEARTVRQKILERDPPFMLSVILDESVLHRRVGDNNVMREQLQRLLEISDRENVNLQVLTLDAKHPTITGAFILLEFGDIPAKLYPDVAYIEHLTGTLYFEEERDTHLYHLAFRRLSDYAADQAHSRRMVSKAMANWA